MSTFELLLGDISAACFFEDFFEKTPLLIKGATQSIGGLFSWEELNSALRSHRIDHPRLRICNESNPLSQGYSGFMNYRADIKGEIIPTINKKKLNQQLADGGTLIIDGCQGMFSSHEGLFNEISDVFRANINVNLYASWKSTPGFGLHFDTHDVFVLQLDGEKLWQLYGETYEKPLPRQRSSQFDKPHQISEEIHLQKGDLLYVPRGHWHNVVGLDKPSLHITIGVHRVKWGDALFAMLRGALEDRFFRENLPLSPTPQQLEVFKTKAIAHLINMNAESFFESFDAVTESDSFNFPNLK